MDQHHTLRLSPPGSSLILIHPIISPVCLPLSSDTVSSLANEPLADVSWLSGSGSDAPLALLQ